MPTTIHPGTQCPACGGPLYEFIRSANIPGPNDFEIGCNVCGKMLYGGNNKQDADYILNKYTNQGFVNKANILHNTLTTRLPSFKIGDVVEVTESFTSNERQLFCIGDKFKLSYYAADYSKVLSKFNEYLLATTELLGYFRPASEETVTNRPIQKFSMKEAYEANKESNFCVVCGTKTTERALFTGVVSYCSCIEKLPR